MSENNKTYLSKEKFEELRQELEHLRTVSRKEVAEKLEYAKSLGDLSENTEYQEARESHAGIEDRIATVESLLKSAVIAEEPKGDRIDIGSVVTVRKEKGGGEATYRLVGSEEADIAAGKVSNRSPLGEAIMGKKEGDSFTYKTPNGEVVGIVIQVE